MPDFTREELKSAIQDCLGSGFATEVDAGGQLDPGVSKLELLRFAALTTLQNPDALFYWVSAFAGDLTVSVISLISDIDDALEAVACLGKKYRSPDIEILEKAGAHLSTLTAALERKKHSPYARQQAVVKIGEYGDQVAIQLETSGGLSYPPGDAARILQQLVSGLPATAASLREDVDDVLAADIGVSTLEYIYLYVTVAKVYQLLEDKRVEISVLTGADLEREVRGLYLFLRVAENILGVQNSYPDPQAVRFQGTGVPVNTAAGPAATVVAAVITGITSTPLVVTAANKQFVVDINGAANTVTLAESPVARVTNSIAQTYDIHAAAQASIIGSVAHPPGTFDFLANEDWRVYVDGIYFEGTIPLGSYTCDQLITLLGSIPISHPTEGPIQNWLDLSNVGNVLKLAYHHNTETTGDHRIIIGNFSTSNGIMGFTDYQDTDDAADTKTVEGMDGNTEIKFIVDNTVEQAIVLSVGATQSAVDIANDIDGLTGASSGVYDTDYVYVDSDALGDGARIIVSGGDALATLGFTLNQIGVSSHRYPQQLVDDVNSQITGAHASNLASEKSAGVCQTVVGVGNEDLVDLPTGEGVKMAVNEVLLIKTGPNAGAHKITGKSGDQLTLERDQFVTAGPVSQQYAVVTNYVVLTSTKLDALDSSLRAVAASLFGFPTTLVWGQVSDIELSEVPKYVRPGDTAVLAAVSYEVSSISGDRLVVTPLVPMDTSSGACTVYSADERAYTTLAAALTAWKRGWDNGYPNFNDLVVAANRLLVSASLVNKTAVTTLLTELRGYLQGVGSLSEALEACECRGLPPIERLMGTLENRKSRRAIKLLRQLEFSDFFDLDVVMSHDAYAHDKLVELLREYVPTEAVRTETEDQLLDDSDVVGVELVEAEQDINYPDDYYLEPDDVL